MDIKKTTTAFCLIFIGVLVQYLPDTSWCLAIVSIIGGIMYIVGLTKLTSQLDGYGTAGAFLILISVLLGVIVEPFSIADGFSGFAASLKSEASNYVSDMMGFGRRGYSPYDSYYDDPALVVKETASLSFSLILQRVQYVLCTAGLICWLIYKPFERIGSGIIVLLVTSCVFLLNYFFVESFLGIFAGSMNFILPVFGILMVIGYYVIAGNIYPDGVIARKIKSLMLCAAGFMYSILILTDNGYFTIFVSLFGAILWLVGVSRIRSMAEDRNGTGAMLAYGIMTIITSFIQMLPILGGYIAVAVQIAAFIVLGVGFFNFASNSFFGKNKRTGMKTLGTVSLLLIGGSITFLIPTIGEGLTALILSVIYFPMIITAWYNALKTQTDLIPAEIPESVADAYYSKSETAKPNVFAVSQASKETIKETKTFVSDHNKHKSNYESSHNEEPVKQIINTQNPTIHAKTQMPGEKRISLGERFRENSRIMYMVGGIILVVLLLVGGILYYNNSYLPAKKDREAPRYYTFAESTNIRSSKIAGVDHTRIQSLPYGSELITYAIDQEWADVKYDKITGYISSPFLLSKEDFFLLNSIFGDNTVKYCINTAKTRLALLDYYKRNKLYGQPNAENMEKYASYQSGWQVYTKQEDEKPNTIFYPRLYSKNSKFTDFVFIIKNNDTGERRLAVYSFEDDETPVFKHEQGAPKTGYISNVELEVKDGREYVNVKYVY